jgi:serine/threonine protein kinase/Tfp pilus assembly protein PilF
MAITCPKCKTDNPETQKFCGECATPLTPSKEIEVTETIEAPKEELTRGSILADRYEIIEELGKGGMGRVYRVEDTKLKQEIALKLIKPEISSDKKTIERFRNELKLARNIRHKNVCGMFDLGEAEGARFITMEYVSGEDLKSFIRRAAPLSTSRTVSIAKQVCEGLEEAHRIGVVHRDLKPSNIMIDKDGNARIMDFGIARSLKEKGITGAGVMIGTPEYMSPEQVEGKEVDQRTDIYSLGVILYEMVTGRVPFEGDTALSIAVKHKTEQPKDPREFNPQISEDISRIILKCLEKDKDKRYQSAGQVRAELDNIAKDLPTTEHIIPERKPLTSREITVQLSVKKALLPALIFAAIIVIGIVIWQLLPRKESAPILASDKPSIAVMYFKNNTGDESFGIWRTALSDSIITDLSQSKYIRVLSGDQLYSILRKLDLLEATSYASEDLKKVAVEGRVNHILQGNLSKAGDTFRIDYTLQDINTGESVGAERVEGIGEDNIFTMVDSLTRKIKANFRLSAQEISSDIDEDVGKITTRSAEAYRFYAEGRKHFNVRDHQKSIEFMEKAVAIDPEFAMAYRSMAVTYGDMGYHSKDREFISKALEYSDRMTDRERYLIQGDFYRSSEETYEKSIEAYTKLLELYPDDMVGNNNLGVIYGSIMELDKAIELYEVNRRNGDNFVITYTNLAGCYESKGMYEKAKSYYEEYIDNISDNNFVRRRFASHYLDQGKFDLAQSEADKASALDPDNYYNYLLYGDIYRYQGNLVKAEEEWRKLLESKSENYHRIAVGRFAGLYVLQGRFKDAIEQIEKRIEIAENQGELSWAAWGHGYLSYIYWKSGDLERSLDELKKCHQIAVDEDLFGFQIGMLMARALVYQEMNDMDEAIQAAEELKEMIQQGMNPKRMRLYYFVMGMIELKKENFAKAIEYLNEALDVLENGPLDKDIRFIDALALAYYRSGEIDKALAEYERITTLIGGRMWMGDVYAKSFYNLGKIYEEQENTAKTKENYEKFLELWKDADPGIAEVEDAKNRLAGLKN